jgi:hypothetical protein
MGCDIHMYAEQRDESGTWKTLHKWENTAEEGGDYEYWDESPSLDSDRAYIFFGYLASVRRETPFNREPLGLPEDVCMETNRVMEDPDYHTRSFIYEDQLRKDALLFQGDKEALLRLVLENKSDDLEVRKYLDTSATNLLESLEEMPLYTKGRETRFVFAFDN